MTTPANQHTEDSATHQTPMRMWFGFAARGLLIGLADLFPGVSGGTMALLTGVYPRFIHALAGLRPALLLFLRGEIHASLASVDWLFLTATGLGALLSILSFATLIQWLLEHHQMPLFSLFAGLVCYTAFSLMRQVSPRVTTLLLGLAGFAGAFFLREFADLLGNSDSLLAFAFGGAVAICAMMLPGISGSLLLLLLGLYEPLIHALTTADMSVIGLFATGAMIGLLLFAPLLRYSYQHFEQYTLAFLAGLTFGAIRETLPLDTTASPATLATTALFVVAGLLLGKLIHYLTHFHHAKDH